MKKWEREYQEDLFIVECICKVFITFSLFAFMRFLFWFFMET